MPRLRVTKQPFTKLILLSLLAPLCWACNGRSVLTEDIAPRPAEKRKKVQAQVLSADEINNRSRQSVNVWFVSRREGDKFSFVPVTRAYKPAPESENATGDALYFALSQLMKGPSGDEAGSGIASEIPRGTVLIAVANVSARPGANSGEKGGLVLDLSKHFVSGGGMESFETRLEQLKRTVNDVAGGEPVYLNVEGQRLTQTPGDGIEVPQPINR